MKYEIGNVIFYEIIDKATNKVTENGDGIIVRIEPYCIFIINDKFGMIKLNTKINEKTKIQIDVLHDGWLNLADDFLYLFKKIPEVKDRYDRCLLKH